MKRTEARHAVAELWYFYEVLLSIEKGGSRTALSAIAYKTDEAVETIAEFDWPLMGPDYREFRSKVLKSYRILRETADYLRKY